MGAGCAALQRARSRLARDSASRGRNARSRSPTDPRDLVAVTNKQLTQRFGGDWPAAVNRDGRVPENARADGHFLLKAMIHLWRDGGFGDVLGHSERSWVGELMEIRNRWAHNETFTTDQAYRALDTAQLLLNACNAGVHASEIEKMRQELLRTRFAEEERRVRKRQARAATEGEPVAGLKP